MSNKLKKLGEKARSQPPVLKACEENEKYNKPCPYNPAVMCVQMPCHESDDNYCDDGCPNAELREKLAELAHSQWSGWMDYLFSKCIDYKASQVQAEVGALIIPKWAVDRWRGQAAIIYEDLSRDEKNSDRTEADKFLEVFFKAWNTRQPDTEWAKKHMVQLRKKIMAQQDAIGKYVVGNKRHREALEWIKEHHSCEFSCDDCDTPMLCSKKVAKQALLKGDEDGKV